MSRDRLPDRRVSFNVDFCHAGQWYTTAAGFYPDGRLGEIWLDTAGKGGGSDMSIALHDVATVASLALQFGCPAETMIGACQRHEDGTPAGVLGAALVAIQTALAEMMEDA